MVTCKKYQRTFWWGYLMKSTLMLYTVRRMVITMLTMTRLKMMASSIFCDVFMRSGFSIVTGRTITRCSLVKGGIRGTSMSTYEVRHLQGLMLSILPTLAKFYRSSFHGIALWRS